MEYSLVSSLGTTWNGGFVADISVTNQGNKVLDQVIFKIQVEGTIEDIWGATSWEPVDGWVRVTLSNQELAFGETSSLRIKVSGDASWGIRLEPVADAISTAAAPTITQAATAELTELTVTSDLGPDASVSTSGNVVTVDGSITASQLQALVDGSPAGTVISLAAGHYRFDRTITVSRGDIAIVGAGSDNTFIELPSNLGQEAFRLGDGDRSGNFQLAGTVREGGMTLSLTGTHSFKAGDFMYLSRASTAAFYDEIGDTTWRKTDVPLRTSIVQVAAVDGNQITLASGVHFEFVPGETTVQEIDLARNITLGGFTLDYGLGSANPSNFSNTLSTYDRNAVIEVSGTAGLHLTDLVSRDVPSLGVNVALSRDAQVDRVTMTGAHNKGDGGNGYALQLRDVYDSSFANLSDQDMRHSVVFASWRSAVGNDVHVLSTDRDINFHGGRHHDNTVWVDNSLRDANSDIISPTLFYNLNGTQYGAPTDPTTNLVRFGQVLGSRLADNIQGYDNGAWLDGAGGNDTLTGGSANDLLRGGAGSDILHGGAGTDLAEYDGKFASFLVTPGSDGSLTVQDKTGGQGTDILRDIEWLVFDDGALRLSDMAFRALSAIDGVFSGPGTHTPGMAIAPTPGSSPTTVPTTGTDLTTAGTAATISDAGLAAILDGTAGDDVFLVAHDSTVVKALEGLDTVRASVDFTMSADLERLELVGGRAIDGTGSIANDLIVGNDAGNRLRGGSGRDQLLGNAGDDRLNGDSGDDELDGGLGNDALRGGSGNDALSGGAGHDSLNGGSGRDLMAGGEGRDIFLFSSVSNSRAGSADRIADFESGEDIIDLRTVDANSTLSGDQAFVWNGTAAGRLVLQSGYLSGDVNGDGKMDFQIDMGSAWIAREDILF